MKNLIIQWLIVLTITAPAGSLLAATASTTPQKPPNVVIIFTDDQGYADVGVYGAKGYKTPNLDRMAKEGIRFTDFHVAQPVCSASRAAMLTGCYPSRVGIMGALGPEARIGLNTNEWTIARMLKQKGYNTAMFGKWHIGRPTEMLPTRHGFDQYLGLPYSNDMWPLHPEAKPGTYPPLPLIEGEKVIKAELTHQDQEQLTTWYTERAVQFIASNTNTPFFLYVAPNMPHVPLHVSDKFKGKSKLGLYGDVIMEIDWCVGQILETLKKFKLDENTLVIFSSDNGPWLSYGEHAGSAYPLREGKGTSWEGGTRVPFIARWPGHIPSGQVCKQMAMTIDLLPTIACLTGAPLPPHTIDGLNIWPLFTGEKKAVNPHDAYFFYYANNELQAVRTAKWKLVFPHNYRSLGDQPMAKGGIPAKYKVAKVTSPELYDMQSDIEEKHNVAAKHPDVIVNMEAIAERCRVDLGDSLTGQKGENARPPGRIPAAQK